LSAAVWGEAGEPEAMKMGYQPIYDGEFDVVVYNDETDREARADGLTIPTMTEVLESVFKHKLIMTNFVGTGPGGHPAISIRGTRRQFLAWFNDFYDPDHGTFQRDECSDAATWANAVAAYGLTFVA
jgi:hypothetical protein